MKQYIVDIKGICILEDEWEDAKITITRNGIADTIEFDKSDIVKTEEIDRYYNKGFRQFHCSNTLPIKKGGVSGAVLIPFNNKLCLSISQCCGNGSIAIRVSKYLQNGNKENP